jgi:hypothetical protein
VPPPVFTFSPFSAVAVVPSVADAQLSLVAVASLLTTAVALLLFVAVASLLSTAVASLEFLAVDWRSRQFVPRDGHGAEQRMSTWQMRPSPMHATLLL